MKTKRFELKHITIEINCNKIYNGFEFTPLHICKFDVSYNNYFCIVINLIKLSIGIDFIWKKKKKK